MSSQLSYEGIQLSDYNHEVQAKYAFPEDKDHLLRIMRGERYWSRQELMNSYDQAQNDAVYSTVAISVGAIAFAFYLMPGGKVIRDRYVAKMTPTRQLFRQFLPFAGLALPMYLVRSRLDESNGYTN